MEEIAKKRKTRKFGHYQAPTSQRREPTLRRRPTPWLGIPRRGETEVPKWHPSGTPRRSIAVPRRSCCSQREIFGLLFRKSSFRTPVV